MKFLFNSIYFPLNLIFELITIYAAGFVGSFALRTKICEEQYTRAGKTSSDIIFLKRSVLIGPSHNFSQGVLSKYIYNNKTITDGGVAPPTLIH